MGKSLHKDILNTLKSASKLPIEGNHLRRLITLSSMITSCIETQSSTIEGISCEKNAEDTIQSESRLKQSSRWLSSKWTDYESFFAPFARQLLFSLVKSKGELIFIVDGSQTGNNFVTLMVSVICKGYAIPIVWLMKAGEKGHFSEEMHLDLAKYLHQLVPNRGRIVFLGDGEFDGQKLRSLFKDFSWEFVLRTSKDRKIDCGGELAQLQTVVPPEGEEIFFIEDACDGDNAVYWHSKGYKDPIFLFTNMDLGPMACDYYRRRFKIETLFKFFKSGGFKIHKTKIVEMNKLNNLLIVLAFAFIFAFTIGCILKQQEPDIINKITRFDRVQDCHPITLVIRCFQKKPFLLTYFLSLISKNWMDFFY
jgi:hypothetical protein